jgi:hypothetical protein
MFAVFQFNLSKSSSRHGKAFFKMQVVSVFYIENDLPVNTAPDSGQPSFAGSAHK